MKNALFEHEKIEIWNKVHFCTKYV